jgi:hypothetical protein
MYVYILYVLYMYIYTIITYIYYIYRLDVYVLITLEVSFLGVYRIPKYPIERKIRSMRTRYRVRGYRRDRVINRT